MPASVVKVLESMMLHLEDALVKVVQMLYDSKLPEAESELLKLADAIRTFQETVERDLADARTKLSCCHVEHTLPQPPSRALMYVLVLVMGILVWIIVGSCCVVAEGRDGPMLMQSPSLRF